MLMVLSRTWAGQQKCAFPIEAEQSTLCLLVPALTLYTVPFHGPLSAKVFAFSCFLLISLLTMAPRIVLHCCLVSLSTKRLRCVLQRKISVLDELHSGRHYTTAGREFSINESTAHIR